MVNLKFVSAVCAAAALSATPLLAGATVPANGQIMTNVSATVVSDCEINTTGSLTLAFGNIDLIRSAPTAPTATFNITCNKGTQWQLGADSNGQSPVALTSAGYSASFSPNAVAYNVTAAPFSGTATSSTTAFPVTLTGTITTADPPVGTYNGSFVVSVMI